MKRNTTLKGIAFGILFIAIVMSFVGCTAVSTVDKLEKKGFEKISINYSDDYETWYVDMVKKNTNGIVEGTLLVYKCRNMFDATELCNHKKRRIEKNGLTGYLAVRKGSKVFYGTEKIVNEAVK